MMNNQYCGKTIVSRFCLLLWLLSLSFMGQAQVIHRTVHLRGGLMVLKEIRDSLKAQLGVTLLCKDVSCDLSYTVRTDGDREYSLSECEHFFRAAGYIPEMKDSNILTLRKEESEPSLPADPFRWQVKVLVSDENGAPLPGATISFLRNKPQVITDSNGTANFNLHILPDTLVVTYMGMETVRKELPQSGRMNIIMHYKCCLLGDCITPGIPTLKKYMTGNTCNVGGEVAGIQPVSNPLAILSGSVAGVLGTARTGITGGAYDIVIRGAPSFMNRSNALYVIDGTPFRADPSVSTIITGNAGGSLSPFSFLSKWDIASMEILKDAEATAIYGPTGANGVILIHTWQAKKGKPSLHIGFETGYSEITRAPKLENTQQYVQMRTEALTNDATTPNDVNAPDLTKWDTTRYTNWQKTLVDHLASTISANVSLSGGNDRHTYLASVGWLREKNVFEGEPAHDRATLNSHFNQSAFHHKLEFHFSTMASYDLEHQVTYNPWTTQFLAPNAPSLRYPNGQLVFSENGVSINNPLTTLSEPYRALSYNLLVNGELTYKLQPSLTCRINLGGNLLQTNESSQIPIEVQDPSRNPTGSSFWGDVYYKNWIIEPQLEYQRDWRKWHIVALGGFSWQGLHSVAQTISALGFTNDQALSNPALADSVDQQSDPLDYVYRDYYSRLNLRWQNKYLLTLTSQLDQSNRWEAGRQSGIFGTAAAGWVFSNEPFLRDHFPLLSLGKLRASYGISGNDQLGAYHYMPTWASVASSFYQTTPFTTDLGHSSGTERWERVRKLELGLETQFDNDRIAFEACWYQHTGDHLLIPVSLSSDTLYNSRAVIRNSGWELSLHPTIIDQKGLQWKLSFNINFPMSRLIAFPGLASSPFSKLLVTGQSPNVFKAFHYIGIDGNGLFHEEDRNGDGRFTDADRIIGGSADVTIFGGIGSCLIFHQWKLDILTEGRQQKGIDYQAAIYSANPPGSLKTFYSNETTDINDHWRKPGDHTLYQKLTTSPSSAAGRALANYLGSTGIIRNASYVRVKTLTLTYRLPDSWEKTHLPSGDIYIAGQNLFTFTRYKGVDPETRTILTMPPLKTIVIGVSLNLGSQPKTK